jgi:hypothetical protein
MRTVEQGGKTEPIIASYRFLRQSVFFSVFFSNPFHAASTDIDDCASGGAASVERKSRSPKEQQSPRGVQREFAPTQSQGVRLHAPQRKNFQIRSMVADTISPLQSCSATLSR